MRRSRNPAVLAIGELQDQVCDFLNKRELDFSNFFDSAYGDQLAVLVENVRAINLNNESLDSKVEPTTTEVDEQRVESENVEGCSMTKTEDAPNDGERYVRYSDKWKENDEPTRVSIEGGHISDEAGIVYGVPTDVQSIATPAPQFTDYDASIFTPLSRTSKPVSVIDLDWGNRFQSMSSLDVPGYRPIVFPQPLQPNDTRIDHPSHQATSPRVTEQTPFAETHPEETPVRKQQREDIDAIDGYINRMDTVMEDYKDRENHFSSSPQTPPPRVSDQSPLTETAPEAIPFNAQMTEIANDVAAATVQNDTVMEDCKNGEKIEMDAQDLIPITQPQAMPFETEREDVKVEGDPMSIETEAVAEPEDQVKELPPWKTATKLKNLLTFADEGHNQLKHMTKQATLQPKEMEKPIATSNVTSFLGCIKSARVELKPASGKHKGDIPALRKAAAARELETKRAEERKKRKERRTQWKAQQKSNQLPAKRNSKPDTQTSTAKPFNACEPTPSKKRRFDNNRPPKKIGQQTTLTQFLGPRKTPAPPIIQDKVEEMQSPQYDMTPVGELASDTRTKRKERRKDKHIPSWAKGMALERSILTQRTVDPASVFPPVTEIDLLEVFGQPNPMVMRNAAERTYQYENRHASSVFWSDDDTD